MNRIDSKTLIPNLVPLLIGLGVLTIVGGLLILALQQARESAGHLKSKSNLEDIGLGLQMFCDNNDGNMPDCSAKDGKNAPCFFRLRQGSEFISLLGIQSPLLPGSP